MIKRCLCNYLTNCLTEYRKKGSQRIIKQSVNTILFGRDTRDERVEFEMNEKLSHSLKHF